MSARWMVVGCVAGIAACAGTGGEDDGAACTVVPDAWQAPDFDVTAADALALRADLDALAGGTLREAEQGTRGTPTVAELDAAYRGGDPSLASVGNPAYAPVVTQAFEDLVALLEGGNTDLFDESGWSPGPVGGVAGEDARGFNAGGLEVRQFVDKGLYAGGGLYPYALALTEGAITPDTIDAIAAAWGADASLSADTATDSAGYSLAQGAFAPIAASLTAAKAYAADPACEPERDAALVDAFRAWEAALAARCVHYAAFAAEVFAAPEAESELIDGLHEFSEGLALIASFRGLPDPSRGPLAGAGRQLTDATIDEVMGAFGVDLVDLSASTTGTFVSDAPGLADALTQVEQALATALGWSAADVDAARNPTKG